MTTTYVTVGLQRIQAHLARSRHLWGRRGASEEIVRLTMLPATAEAKGLTWEAPVTRAVAVDGVELNDEALDIDGVVSLRGDDRDTVVEAAKNLARAMKERLPGLTIEVSWVTAAEGERYVDLLQAGAKARWTRVTFHPAPAEFPLVRPCDECRTGPASRSAQPRFSDTPGETVRLCVDCFNRLEHAERRSQTVVTVAGRYPNKFCSEWWLLDLLNDRRPDGAPKLQGSDHLTHLAQQVRPDPPARVREHRDNHTALIAADGNGMGGLFEAATRQAAVDGNTKSLQELSKSVKSAMSDALVAATEAILNDDDTILPAVPHILGGDDLLVSLPAEQCWEFLQVFLDTFQRLSTEFSTADLPVSLSAGMVICRAAVPLGNQVESAEHLLKRAKREVGGDGWSFAWLDLTQDGPGGEHQVWSLDDLAERQSALAYLSEMTESSVRGLMAALAGEDARVAAQQEDVRVAAQKLRFLTHRMPEIKDLLDLLAIRTESLDAQDAQLIRDLISVGRWWR